MKILPENFCSKERDRALQAGYSYLEATKKFTGIVEAESLLVSGGHYKEWSFMIQAPAVLLDC